MMLLRFHEKQTTASKKHPFYLRGIPYSKGQQATTEASFTLFDCDNYTHKYGRENSEKYFFSISKS